MDTQLKNDLNEELKELEEKNLLWNPKTLEGPSVARSKVGGKEVLMLCSNNYLGLSNNPILKEAAKKGGSLDMKDMMRLQGYAMS